MDIDDIKGRARGQKIQPGGGTMFASSCFNLCIDVEPAEPITVAADSSAQPVSTCAAQEHR